MNRGRDIRGILGDISNDPDELYYATVGGRELLDALERTSSEDLNAVMNYFGDLYEAAYHQPMRFPSHIPDEALAEAARSSMFRTGSELFRRGLTGNPEAIQVIGPGLAAMDDFGAVADILQAALSESQSSAALAELITKLGGR